ncbi:hypothetical protein ACQCX2_09610 [Propionibacteriaceae bacterium Y1700]|uniref:hypothetical protein n=1 Tax=Microlunatus sp. Y1700 TaxID=3418487 RepID=UPI003DA6DFDD
MGNLSIHTQRLRELSTAMTDAAPAVSEAHAMIDEADLTGTFPAIASSVGLPEVQGRAVALMAEVTTLVGSAVEACATHLADIAATYVELEERNSIPHQPGPGGK